MGEGQGVRVFDTISGHERQLEVLRRNVKSGQMPPAYLFHGEDGIGKRMAALEIARAVNCAGDMFGEVPCGNCQSCHNVASGCHPNVRMMELEPNPDTGKMRQAIIIDQVRSAQEFLSLRSVGEGRKVLIVDGANLMNAEAANAFLKTLEEPPDNSHIILLTSRPSFLLPTILSRCRAIAFQPLEEGVVAKILVEKKGLSPGEASLVARMTGGRVGDALEADPKDLAERRDDFIKTLAGLAGSGPSGVLGAAEAAAKEGGLEEFVFFGSMWFRDLLVILVGGGPGLAYNRDIIEELSRWAAGMTAYRCEEALGMLKGLSRALEHTYNRRLLAEDLFFRLKEEVLA